MAELPFLFLRRPAVTKRAKLGGGGARYTKPSAADQRARLEARFATIVQGFAGLQTDVAGVVPEQVIVIETLTQAVDGVAKAAASIPGLEWLAELELDDQPPEFGFAKTTEPDAKVPRRLYALMSNQAAMTGLLQLWRHWVENPGERAKRGFGPFKRLFELLKDIRHWSPEDRVRETGILERWREHVDIGATMLFEVEFWYRTDAGARNRAVADLETGLGQVGGTIVAQAAIDPIHYHAALIEVPGAAIQQFLGEVGQQTFSRVLRSEGVMFFRPRAQAAFGISPLEIVTFDLDSRLAGQAAPAGPAVVALLDGLPMTQHACLAGRLVVDDPDDVAALYSSRQRQHCTAMASTMVHGDLHEAGAALTTPVYVRPIFEPDGFNGQSEVTPPRQLLVDLIHRAFVRMFVGVDGQAAVASSVRIVNLSLGDPYQAFDRTISALAKLLDWLAWRFRVLIVVSIGNHHRVPIELGSAWSTWGAPERSAQVLRSMQATQLRRRPLSPSEAINCLSVGATHEDHAGTFLPGDRIDLTTNPVLPSPLGTVAQGFRRATKPEVLFPGGRLLHRLAPASAVSFDAVDTTLAPGILTATPGIAAMELGRVEYGCGTSNAAALATRCAARALQVLRASDIPGDVEPLGGDYIAVVLKALVVHGASWGDAEPIIQSAFPEAASDWRRMSRLKQQFLGFGAVDVSRCLASSESRATMLAWGEISREQAHTYSVPLPPTLASSTDIRWVTTTLAWLTPANYRHQNYRRAQLWMDVGGTRLAESVRGLDAQSARRGTIEHRILEGQHAVPFVDGAAIEIRVNCKDDAGKLDVAVPYAVAVSVEVGVQSTVDVFNEIRLRIRPTVEVTTTPS